VELLVVAKEDESDGLPVEDPILDTAVAIVDGVAGGR
jgi:hypothetical protein